MKKMYLIWSRDIASATQRQPPHGIGCVDFGFSGRSVSATSRLPSHISLRNPLINVEKGLTMPLSLPALGGRLAPQKRPKYTHSASPHNHRTVLRTLVNRSTFVFHSRGGGRSGLPLGPFRPRTRSMAAVAGLASLADEEPTVSPAKRTGSVSSPRPVPSSPTR